MVFVKIILITLIVALTGFWIYKIFQGSNNVEK